MKKIFLAICFFFLNYTFGQITINGIVKSETNFPLQYVNIGIKNKNIGTISDEKGNFSITIDNTRLNELLTFSYVGFQEKTIKIEELIKLKFLEIILKVKTTELQEVVVISTKPNVLKIGTKSYSSMVAGYVRANNDKNNDIQEFAKEIKLKKPSHILDVNINLFNVKVDTASFRINVYDIKNELPNEKINLENIIVKKKVENGWNKFDLENFNLKYDAPIFVTIEYLPKKGDEEEPFRYSGQLLGKVIKRSSSLGTWNSKSGLTMAMYVDVKQ
jgi:carboxypeptidase-like protein